MKTHALVPSVAITAAILATTTSIYGAEVTVAATGADFTTIQDALDNTVGGDTIRVTDQGTYGAFAVQDRTLISDPPGSTITGGTVLIEDPSGSTTSFEGFTFDGSGNAIFMNGSGGSAGTLELDSCTVSNTNNHGVLFDQEEGGALTATDTTFSNCGENAITLFRNATVNLTNCTLENNGSGTGSGRGILIDGSASDSTGRVLNLDNTTISGSAAGGLTMFRFGSISLSNGSSLEMNGGRGLFLDGDSAETTIEVDNSSITGNGLDGIAFFRPGTLTIQNGSSISGNTLRGVNMEDFVSNTAPAEITVTDSTIENNGDHGLFHKASAADTTLTVADSKFSGNSLRGLSVEGTPGASEVIATIERNVLEDGSSNSEAPLLAFDLAVNSVIKNNLVDGGVAGIALNRPTVDVFHNTIVNVAGGAIDLFDGQDKTINVKNNIIAAVDTGLSADTGGGGGVGLANLDVDFNLFETTDEDFNSVFSGSVGSNNDTSGSPAFVSPDSTVGAGDYQLTASSAAIAAGDPAVGIADDLVSGMRPLPVSTDPDMGAYEFDQSTQVDDWQMF